MTKDELIEELARREFAWHHPWKTSWERDASPAERAGSMRRIREETWPVFAVFVAAWLLHYGDGDGDGAALSLSETRELVAAWWEEMRG